MHAVCWYIWSPPIRYSTPHSPSCFSLFFLIYKQNIFMACDEHNVCLYFVAQPYLLVLRTLIITYRYMVLRFNALHLNIDPHTYFPTIGSRHMFCSFLFWPHFLFFSFGQTLKSDLKSY